MSDIKIRGPDFLSNVNDFSARASQAILKETLEHPLTIYPPVFGTLGIFWMTMFDPTPISLLVTLGGFGLGAGNWILNYFFRWDVYLNKCLGKLREEINRQRKLAIKGIDDGLKECELTEDSRDIATQGRTQFSAINTRFETLDEILSQKTEKGELMHLRFLGATEQVYFAALDNLRDLANFLKGLRAIGKEYKAQLLRLEKLKTPTGSELKQISVLQERNSLRERHLERAGELLALNEEALTQIDVMIGALAEAKLSRGQTSANIEFAMNDLRTLAERLRKYSITD